MDTRKIGSIISNKRKELSLTQQQLADLLNVSNKSISRWENGTTMPDISLLVPLADALHISLNELLGVDEGVSEETLKVTIDLSTDTIHKEKQTKNKFILATLFFVWVLLYFFPWANEITAWGNSPLFLIPPDTINIFIVLPAFIYYVLLFIKPKSRWIFFTSISYIHILACTLSFRYRFLDYANAELWKQNLYCCLPIIGLIIFNVLKFKDTFNKQKN